MAQEKYTVRLKDLYKKEIVPKMMKDFGFKNTNEVPTIKKIVVSMGIGEAARDSKAIRGAIDDLSIITSQKPRLNKAKKSIAQFKLREGQTIGANSTLRSDRMWEFLDRTISTAIPRVRDFRGYSPKQFDGSGNYSFGLNEQVVYLEIDQDKIDKVRGMDITIVTSAKTDEQARSLLKYIGFPLKEK